MAEATFRCTFLQPLYIKSLAFSDTKNLGENMDINSKRVGHYRLNGNGVLCTWADYKAEATIEKI